MKKYIIGFVTVMAMAASVAFANSSIQEPADHKQAIHAHMEGKHCRGTVGCDCPGFAPITKGKHCDTYYCRHCGNKKSYHR